MVCIVCKKFMTESLYISDLICSNECFEINFWNEYVKFKDDKNSVRINGNHYRIKSYKLNSSLNGLNSEKFVIKFFDGRIVTTNNLWNQGKIPEKFKELLPDNATFI